MNILLSFVNKKFSLFTHKNIWIEIYLNHIFKIFWKAVGIHQFEFFVINLQNVFSRDYRKVFQVFFHHHKRFKYLVQQNPDVFFFFQRCFNSRSVFKNEINELRIFDVVLVEIKISHIFVSELDVTNKKSLINCLVELVRVKKSLKTIHIIFALLKFEYREEPKIRISKCINNLEIQSCVFFLQVIAFRITHQKII